MLWNSYRKHVRPVKTVISFVNYGGIVKDGYSVNGRPVGLVDVAEEVQDSQVHGAKLINSKLRTHFHRATVLFQSPVKIFKAFLTEEGCINEFQCPQTAAVAH